ncbi:hypothetical protein ACHAQA_010040 [Verticillium albo-atrum]
MPPKFLPTQAALDSAAKRPRAAIAQQRLDKIKSDIRELVAAENKHALQVNPVDKTTLEDLETLEAEQAHLLQRLADLKTDVKAKNKALDRVLSNGGFEKLLEYDFSPESTVLIAGFQLLHVGDFSAVFRSNATLDTCLRDIMGRVKPINTEAQAELTQRLLQIARRSSSLEGVIEQGLDNGSVIVTAPHREAELQRRLDVEMAENKKLRTRCNALAASAKEAKQDLKMLNKSINLLHPILKRGVEAEDLLRSREREIKELKSKLSSATDEAAELHSQLSHSQDLASQSVETSDSGIHDLMEQISNMPLANQAVEARQQLPTRQQAADARELEYLEALDELFCADSETTVPAWRQILREFVTPWAEHGGVRLASPILGATKSSVIALQLLDQLLRGGSHNYVLLHVWVLWTLLRQDQRIDTGIGRQITDQLMALMPHRMGQPLVLASWQLVVELARWSALADGPDRLLARLQPSEVLLWVLRGLRDGSDALLASCKDHAAALYLETEQVALVSEQAWPLILQISFAEGHYRFVAQIEYGGTSFVLRDSSEGCVRELLLPWDLVPGFDWWSRCVHV